MKRIFLCGNSIFLTGLAGSLETVVGVEVIQRPTLSGSMDLMDVDVIVVDFDNVNAGDVLAILRARPGIKMVGVNAAAGAVTVLSGRVYLAQTLDDVVGCLE